MILYKKLFKIIVGKGENAGNQHFLLFPQCFLPFKKCSVFHSHLFCHLQMLFIWTSQNFCCLVKSCLHLKVHLSLSNTARFLFYYNFIPLSVHLSMCLSVQNTSFYQSAGRDSKSHLATALVVSVV